MEGSARDPIFISFHVSIGMSVQTCINRNVRKYSAFVHNFAEYLGKYSMFYKNFINDFLNRMSSIKTLFCLELKQLSYSNVYCVVIYAS